MANKSISGLTASAANLASTDVAPVVQTTGVGPVKMTGLQLAGGLLGSTTFNGSTVTTSSPVLNLTQTWNDGAGGTVTFTGLKFNATDTASASGSLLLELQTGGAAQVSIGKSGAIVASGVTVTNSGATGTANLQMASNTNYGFHMAGNQVLTWGSANQLNGSIDITLRRAAAATLQLGAADASASATVTITIATPGVVTWSNHGLSTGTPVIFSTTGALPTGITAGTTYYVIAVGANTFQIATSYANATAVSPTAVATSGSQSGTHTGTRGAVDQVFRVQSASGTANFPGADFTIQGSRGTGTGAGGSIIFQVAPAGSAGSSQNAYSTALTINSAQRVQAATWIDAASGLTVSSGPDVVLGSATSYGVTLRSTAPVAWANGVATATQDVFLYRDGQPNTLALRNGTSAQRFNVYNTYTSSTNYETFKVDWITTANTCLIGTEKGSGGGTARALALQTDGTTRLTIATDGTATFSGSIFGGSVAANTTSFPAGDLNICSTTGSIFRLITASNTASVSSSVVFNRASGTVASPTVSSNNDLIGTIIFQCFDGTTRRASAGIFSYVDGTVTGSSSPGRIEFQTTPSGSTTSTTRAIINNAGLFILGATQANTVPALKPSSTTLQVRLGDDTAFAPLACSSLSQTAGIINDASNAYSLTATLPTSPTVSAIAVSYSITSAGSAAQIQAGVSVALNAGYTGSSQTYGLQSVNSTAGTSTAYSAAVSTLSYRPQGNRGIAGVANASTSGLNIGTFSSATQSTTANYGVWGSATYAVNNAWNVGVAGFGLNTGTGTQEIGGFFALYDGGTSAPNLVSAALVADNGTSSNPIFLARDNASTVFTIANGGAVTTTSSIQTGAPTGGTAAAWKFGSRVAATTVLDTTQYIELDIGGTLYKLAVVTS